MSAVCICGFCATSPSTQLPWQEKTSESPNATAPTQNSGPSESPGPKLVDLFFRFEFSDAVSSKEQERAKKPDFVAEALRSLSGLTTEEEINHRMFPPSLFDGMSTSQETVATIHGWLQEAWSDAQTLSHRELATQDFDLRMCGPLPWVRAMQAIALHDGLCPESLNLACDANIGFCEHHATRLLRPPNTTHRGVSPNPSVMLGAAVSARKSHNIETTDHFLEKAEPQDAAGKPGYIAQSKIVISDATLAGIRKALKVHSTAIATVYDTPVSSKRPGAHYLPEHGSPGAKRTTRSQLAPTRTQECADHPYVALCKISGQQDRM